MKLSLIATAILPLSLSVRTLANPQALIDDQVPRAKAILDTWQADQPARQQKKLHIVYWTPSDRDPAPHYRERLTAILEDIRKFYAKEMQRLGFGPRTIALDYLDDGLLRVHLVKSNRPYSEFNGNSGGEIRTESLPILRGAGIQPEKETLVIFCNMSNWDPEKKTISQNSPYYAGGTNRSGTAWQVDSPILNLDQLDDLEPKVHDGQYGHISIGRYNSIFIGGICHELGHALGLPHNRERPDEAAAFGTALMGSGNRTYGENLRNEGKGSFLTLAHGLKLASHPIFCGSVKGIEQPANARLDEIRFQPAADGKSFEFSAKVSSNPPTYAVLAYMDPQGGSDYDATTTTAVPDAEGRFTLRPPANAFAPGKPGVFRVVLVQANGSATTFTGDRGPYNYAYLVAKDGAIDLSATLADIRLTPLLQQLKERQSEGVKKELASILADTALSPAIQETAKVLAGTLDPAPPASPHEIQDAPLCHLSDAKTLDSRTGWGRAAANRLPDPMMVFSCASRLFPRGIYAHAPARHSWQLDGKWNRLTGNAGIPDRNPGGSCVFVIRGDDKELWRSPRTEAGTLRPFDLEVRDVKTLEFIVEDAGDGNGSDWGCWFDPTLHR